MSSHTKRPLADRCSNNRDRRVSGKRAKKVFETSPDESTDENKVNKVPRLLLFRVLCALLYP